MTQVAALAAESEVVAFDKGFDTNAAQRDKQESALQAARDHEALAQLRAAVTHSATL
jgi:hypothetical protein